MSRPRPALFERRWDDVAWRLAVAPLPSLLLSVTAPAMPNTPLLEWGGLLLGGIFKSLVVAVFLGLFTIVVGLPLYLVYRRLNWSSPWLFALGAAAIPIAIYLLPEFGPQDPTFGFFTRDCEVVVGGVRTACGRDVFYIGLTANAVYGALAGLVFWRLLRKRPDPMAKASEPAE